MHSLVKSINVSHREWEWSVNPVGYRAWHVAKFICLVVRIDQGTQSQRLSWKSVLCCSFEGSHVRGSVHYLTVSDIFPMGLWAVSTVRQTNVLISVLDVRDAHCYPQANLVRLFVMYIVWATLVQTQHSNSESEAVTEY